MRLVGSADLDKVGDRALCPFCQIEYDRQMDELRAELVLEGILPIILAPESVACYTSLVRSIAGQDKSRVAHLPPLGCLS